MLNLNHRLALAEYHVSEAAKRAEHQRKLVMQLDGHDYLAERDRSSLAGCEGTLRDIRDHLTGLRSLSA